MMYPDLDESECEHVLKLCKGNLARAAEIIVRLNLVAAGPTGGGAGAGGHTSLDPDLHNHLNRHRHNGVASSTLSSQMSAPKKSGANSREGKNAAADGGASFERNSVQSPAPTPPQSPLESRRSSRSRRSSSLDVEHSQSQSQSVGGGGSGVREKSASRSQSYSMTSNSAAAAEKEEEVQTTMSAAVSNRQKHTRQQNGCNATNSVPSGIDDEAASPKFTLSKKQKKALQNAHSEVELVKNFSQIVQNMQERKQVDAALEFLKGEIFGTNVFNYVRKEIYDTMDTLDIEYSIGILGEVETS